MEDDVLSHCLICSKNCYSSKEPLVQFMFGDASMKEGFSCPQLEAQLNILFVLRKLLKLPGNACERLVLSHGSPSEWGTAFCVQCSDIIEEAQEVSLKITHLLQKFESLQLRMQEELRTNYDACDDMDVSVGENNSRKAIIRLEIRRLCVEGESTSEPGTSSSIRKIQRNSAGSCSNQTSGSSKAKEESDASPAPIIIKTETEMFEEVIHSPMYSDHDHHFGSSDFDDYANPGSVIKILSDEYKESESSESGNLKRQTRSSNSSVIKTSNVSKSSQLNIKYGLSRRSRASSEAKGLKKEKNKKSAITAKGKYKCPLCPNKFQTVNFLNLHYKKIHLGITSAMDKTRSVRKKNQNKALSTLSARRRERKYRFKCPKCAQYFPSEYFKDAHHKRKHQGIEKPFQCDKCGKAFDRNQSLALHRKRCTGDGNFVFPADPKLQESEKFVCAQCSRSFSTEVIRDAHVKRRHEGVDRPFSCQMCEKTFSRHYVYVDHLKNVHSLAKPNFKDEGDDNDFEDGKEIVDDDWVPPTEWDGMSDSDYGDDSKSIKNDEDTDILKKKSSKLTKEKSIKGGIVKKRRGRRSSGLKKIKPKRERHACQHEGCGKLFLSVVLRDGHVKMEHEGIEKPYICDEEGCEKAYTKYFSLQIHKDSTHGRNDQTFICEWCGKTFYNRVAFKRHVYAVHQHKKNVQNKTHPCDECGKFFKGPSGLKRHKECHKNQPPRKCDICEAEFSTKLQLYFHRRTQHLITDPNPNEPASCPQCGKMFRGGYSLKRHQKLVHQQEFKFTCATCKTGYGDKSSYDRHMLTHSGEKPFTCKTCGKGLTRQGDLNRHMRLHTGEKPYTCDQCGESFTDGSKLTKHKKKAHGEPKYDCDVCGKKFYTFTQRRLHKMIHDPDHKSRAKRNVTTVGDQLEPSGKLKTPRKPRKPRAQSENKPKNKRGRPRKKRIRSPSPEFDSNDSSQEFRPFSPKPGRDVHFGSGTHPMQHYQSPSSSAYNLSVHHGPQHHHHHHSSPETYRTNSGQPDFQNQGPSTAAAMSHPVGFFSQQTYLDRNLYLHQLQQHLNHNHNSNS